MQFDLFSPFLSFPFSLSFFYLKKRPTDLPNGWQLGKDEEGDLLFLNLNEEYVLHVFNLRLREEVQHQLFLTILPLSTTHATPQYTPYHPLPPPGSL